MKVKLKCGHTVEVELHGEKICPKKCKGTFKCPVCKSVECDCKKYSQKIIRINEVTKTHLPGTTFEWDKKHYSNNSSFLKGGGCHAECTEAFDAISGHRWDKICVHCGQSYGHHYSGSNTCPDNHTWD